MVALVLLAGPAAQASTPSVFVGSVTSRDRYQPQVTFTYTAPVTVTDPTTQVTVHRVGSSTPVAFTGVSSGNDYTLTITGTLSSGTDYRASVLPDGDTTADQATWKTRGTPAHKTLHVKIVTAIASDAVSDIAHRLDRLNLLAVPRSSDLVDISAATGRALTSSDLKGYQAAFVVTDEDVFDSSADASALSKFAAAGHGVVLAGGTHWTAGGANWTAFSAIGSPSSTWATTWSPLGDYVDPGPLEGGSLKRSTVVSHFITHDLTSLTVQSPGSGSQWTHQNWNEQILARLAGSSNYPAGQSLVAIHSEIKAQPGRVVDLGFNPWSTDVAGGGFSPSQTQAGTLIGRSLWWSMNRIPPTHTHFVTKPANPSRFATVLFGMGAKDADTGDGVILRYQYRVNNGRWKWAKGGSGFALYHLRAGHRYRVRARAVDSGGNRDPHPASYRFRLSSSAYG